MAVNLSPVGGVAAQFFTNTGAVLTGGKLYTYAAGTTTPVVTYTTSQGNIPWTNPVVLDAAGRVPGSGEIWLTDGIIYKFVLKDSNDVLIATYDNVTGINSNSVSYTNAQEIVTATAGQTVFNLGISYQPGTNSLSVFVDGVNQYGPGAQYSYVETDATTVTFNSGLHVGAEVKFTTTQQQGAGAVDASQVSYDPPFTGSVATNVEAKLAEYVSVIDFGADPTGVDPSDQAFVDALAAANYVFVPPGSYTVSTQIDITGDKTISGPGGASFIDQAAVITFTGASGNLFSATSAEFGGICIRNLTILGGNGDYAIRSSRPQSVFENILMEPYNGGGVQLFEAGTGSQASWSTMIRQVKWAAPASATAYRGFQLAINGGHVTLDGCVAVRGAIGINIDQGEAINIYRCSTNQQSIYSSEPASDTCAIRLSGGGYKKAVSIRHSYIEGYVYGIYVEKCESLSIEDNYIADLGMSSNYASVYLKDANVNNVTIRNNNISDQGNLHAAIDIGNGASNVFAINNIVASTGTNAIGIRKGTTTASFIEGNTITVDVSGYAFVDPNYLLVNLDFAANGFTSGVRQAFTSADNTWYDLANVANNQVWRLLICDSNAPQTWKLSQDLFIDAAGAATFETIYDVQAGYAVRAFQVSAGVLQFRTASAGGNTLNTVTAMRIA